MKRDDRMRTMMKIFLLVIALLSIIVLSACSPQNSSVPLKSSPQELNSAPPSETPPPSMSPQLSEAEAFDISQAAVTGKYNISSKELNGIAYVRRALYTPESGTWQVSYSYNPPEGMVSIPLAYHVIIVDETQEVIDVIEAQ